MRTVIDWLEHRTGIESAVKNFLYEDIPASAGWHQIIGSMAVFFFVIQVFTGGLLAFNYAPTPGEAYNSVKYIMTELTGGPLIRGLHHWGASMMLIIVVLHMIQVFIYGAYKKPREATWMVGVTLLLITLAFGLTGYLLPWDNRAYFGTVVTTHITSQSAPCRALSAAITRRAGRQRRQCHFLEILRAPHRAAAAADHHPHRRFTSIWCASTASLPRRAIRAPKRKFFPEQVFKDTVGVAIAFIILFLMAVVAKVPLERLADPTDTAYIPRPEWYFLFLFQMLKFFKGPLETFGSVVLPGIAVLTLFLVPFIDRGPMIRLGKRTFAITFVILAAIAWTGLTTAAVVTTPKNQESVEDYIGANLHQSPIPNPQPRPNPNPRLAAFDAAGIGRPWALQEGRLHRLPSRRGTERHRARSHQTARQSPQRNLDGSALQESLENSSGQRHAAH